MTFPGRYIPVIIRKPRGISDFPRKGSGRPVPPSGSAHVVHSQVVSAKFLRTAMILLAQHSFLYIYEK